MSKQNHPSGTGRGCGQWVPGDMYGSSFGHVSIGNLEDTADQRYPGEDSLIDRVSQLSLTTPREERER